MEIRPAVDPFMTVHRPHRWRLVVPYLFLTPALVLTVIIMFYPLGYSLWISFTGYSLSRPGQVPFVGLDNYVWAITSSSFALSIWNTIVYTVGSVTLEFLLGLGFALLLNTEFRGQGVVRTILMLPLFLTPSVVSLVFLFMYYPGEGVLPWLASFFGVPKAFPFLGDPRTAMISLILVDVWRTTPFMFLVLLAGLQSLPHDIMEAAAIDGASAWQTLRHVTLPLLSPLILVALTIRGMDAFREFDTIYLLTAGGPGQATEVISMLAYNAAFRYFDLGRASAIAYIILLLVLGFSLFFVKKLRDMQMSE
ncbi:MAG: sugar ABC transporter permease [Chloroflexota bacterium]